MPTILIFSALLLTSVSTFASGKFDDLAAKIGSLVSQTDCLKIGAVRARLSQNSEICSVASPQDVLPNLLKINSQIIYQKLAVEEMKDLDCSRERWLDLGSKAESDPIIESIKQSIDAEVPELKALQAAINRFSSANLNPTLAVKNDKTLSSQERTKKIVLIQQAFDVELMKLQDAYDIRLAKIPMSNNPIMKKYIESKFSTLLNTIDPVKISEIKKVIADVNSTLLKDKAETKKSIAENSFSAQLEDKLINNPEHVQSLIKENPEIAQALFKLQCDIENRAKGKMVFEAASTGLTVVIGGSAFALAKASRLAVIASDVEGSLSAANWARSLTYVASSLGSAQTMQYVVKKCSRDIKLSKASCKVSLESFKENEQMTSCLEAGALAASLTFGTKLGYVFKENSEWVKFLERRLAQQASRSPGLKSVPAEPVSFGNLLTIEGKVAGDVKRFQAEITGEKIRADGTKMYQITSTNPDTGKKISATLSESQLLSLKPQNRLGQDSNAIAGIEVREFEDLRLWQQYFQNETTLGIKYRPDAATNLKIIRTPEIPKPRQN